MIEIKIDELTRRRIINAIGKVQVATRYQNDELPREMSRQFVTRVRQDIISQYWVSRWSARGQRYEERYGKWKAEQGYGSDFWKLGGALIAALSSFKVSDGYMAGIPNGIIGASPRYSGTRLYEIAKYAYTLEYGGDYRSRKGGIHPKRPVFTHSINQFAFRESPILGERALQFIAGKWA
jgi:hypothetical protein